MRHSCIWLGVACCLSAGLAVAQRDPLPSEPAQLDEPEPATKLANESKKRGDNAFHGDIAFGLGFSSTYYDGLSADYELISNKQIRPAFVTAYLYQRKKWKHRIGFGPMLVVDTSLDFAGDDLSLEVGNVGFGVLAAFRRESAGSGNQVRGIGIGLAYSITSKVPAKRLADSVLGTTTGHAVQVVLVFAFSLEP